MKKASYLLLCMMTQIGMYKCCQITHKFNVKKDPSGFIQFVSDLSADIHVPSKIKFIPALFLVKECAQYWLNA